MLTKGLIPYEHRKIKIVRENSGGIKDRTKKEVYENHGRISPPEEQILSRYGFFLLLI